MGNEHRPETSAQTEVGARVNMPQVQGFVMDDSSTTAAPKKEPPCHRDQAKEPQVEFNLEAQRLTID